MALGKKIIVWDEADLIKGVSTSDDLADGGFSPNTDAINPLAQPGIMYQPAEATDKSTNLTGEIIASCEDPAGSATRLYTSQDSTQDGRFYSSDSSNVLTARGSEDTGANYIQGSCDMIAFAGEAYVTNSNFIVRWQQPATFNTTFKTFSDGIAPHPALVFENNAYYGDGNELLRQTSAGGAPTAILTLPANQVIVALGIDPGSGKMLISVVGQYNISNTINSDARVLYYDGYSNKAQKVVPVDQMITAFPVTEGGVYAAYGNNLGNWNGNGVQFLKNFANIGFDNTQILYKQHFTNIGSTLYFIVRSKIFAHGPIRQGGEKVFYPAFKNGTVDLTHVTNVGSNNLGFSYATSKFFVWSVTALLNGSSQASQLVFYSNIYTFPQTDGVWLRRVRVFFKTPIANGGLSSSASMEFYNEDGEILNIGNGGDFPLTNDSGAAKAMKEIVLAGSTGLRVYQLQFFMVLPTSLNPGIRRVEIFGDPANQT